MNHRLARLLGLAASIVARTQGIRPFGDEPTEEMSNGPFVQLKRFGDSSGVLPALMPMQDCLTNGSGNG